MTDFHRELNRIREAYRRRDVGSAVASRYDPLLPAAMFRLQGRQWAYAELLRRSGLRTLVGLDILDVGCGGGFGLLGMVALGAEAGRLAGIDLMAHRADAARGLIPQADVRVGSAHEVPFEDDRFDLVLQETLFSSVIDSGLQEAIAAEMLRVLRPGGRILWYDAARGQATPGFVPVDGIRLARLFPGCHVDRRAVTLRWWLNERLVPRSHFVALALERIPVCCSHYAAVIVAPAGERPARRVRRRNTMTSVGLEPGNR